jgi:hypothetical protein
MRRDRAKATTPCRTYESASEFRGSRCCAFADSHLLHEGVLSIRSEQDIPTSSACCPAVHRTKVLVITRGKTLLTAQEGLSAGHLSELPSARFTLLRLLQLAEQLLRAISAKHCGKHCCDLPYARRGCDVRGGPMMSVQPAYINT